MVYIIIILLIEPKLLELKWHGEEVEAEAEEDEEKKNTNRFLLLAFLLKRLDRSIIICLSLYISSYSPCSITSISRPR